MDDFLSGKGVRRLLVICCVSLPVCGGGRVAGQDKDSASTRVLEEVPRAYKRHLEYCQKLQGTVRQTESFHNAKKGKRQHDLTAYEVKANASCGSLMIQSLGPDRFDGELVAVSPRYAFHVKRNQERAEWFISGLERGGDGASFRGESVRLSVERLLTCGYYVDKVNLPDLLTKTEEYKIQKISSCKRDGADAVQIDFDCSHPVRRIPFSPVQGGTVFLDPSRNWCILGYDLKAEWGDGKGSISTAFAYRNSREGMPIVLKVNSVTKNSSNSLLGSERAGEYDLREPDRPPADEAFTLSAYGLPEPEGSGPSNARYWIVAGVGVALVAAAIGLRRAARRWDGRPGK